MEEKHYTSMLDDEFMDPNSYRNKDDGSLNEVIEKMSELFSRVGCSFHPSGTSGVSVCVFPSCTRGFLCNKCLVEQADHTFEHQSGILSSKDVIKSLIF